MPMDVRDRPPRPGDGSGICEPPPDERREWLEGKQRAEYEAARRRTERALAEREPERQGGDDA